MIIRVEMLAGTDIKHATIWAKNKASEWGVAYIRFNFNEVEFTVGQDCNVDETLLEWENTDWSTVQSKYIVNNG